MNNKNDQLSDSSNSALLTDLYQLTMAQGYFHNNMIDTHACFYLFFRDYPFHGGYAVACGIEQISDYINNFKFTKQDISYLGSLKDSIGNKMFTKDFLDFLFDLKLEVSIESVKEGCVVFPNEPVMRVTGPILQCQLIETALLNIFNFASLIATKASRICAAAQCPVMEFGLRRAQGHAGGLWASRAAFVGGCSSTSNVLAGQKFNIPIAGTHAHSWVMTFDNELDAFRAYAKEFPNNCILLVDTYDIEQGIKNAIIVGKEMQARGEHLAGIRIDSGDLTWISKTARKMLDEAGLDDCGIVLSNDLDEYSIKSIQSEGGTFTSLGVGTKLATAYDQPALGGVYKLSATKKQKDNKWQMHMKVSESSSKMTIPGVLSVRRYYNEDGKLAGDMIYDVFEGIDNSELIVDPMDNLRRKKLKGYKHHELLSPLFKEGVCVSVHSTAQQAQERAKDGLSYLDETQKRTLNPHTYPVGIENSLNNIRNKMVAQLRGIA